MTKELAKHAVWFMVLSLCLLLPAAALYLDVVVLDNGIAEYGVTESLQHILILVLIGVFATRTLRQPAQRGFYVLVTGFFLVVLIRETDNFSDYILHGLWKYPALLFTAVAFTVARQARGTVMGPMLAFARSNQGTLVMSGLAVLLFFSRVFGTGHLWQPLTSGATDYATVKTAVQEGSELLGYILITFGAFHHRRMS